MVIAQNVELWFNNFSGGEKTYILFYFFSGNCGFRLPVVTKLRKW